MEIIDIRNNANYEYAIRRSIEEFEKGNSIIYPTDTLYGLGCDIFNEKALKKIGEIKQRRELQPYLILVDSYEMLKKYAIVDDRVEEIFSKYWPGPLTIIFRSKLCLSPFIMDNENKIAIRIPANKFCLELIKKYNKPIVSTSANIHSEPYKNFQTMKDIFQKYINIIVYSGEVESRKPSTIIDLSGKEIKLIREGVIKFDNLVN